MKLIKKINHFFSNLILSSLLPISNEFENDQLENDQILEELFNYSENEFDYGTLAVTFILKKQRLSDYKFQCNILDINNNNKIDQNFVVSKIISLASSVVIQPTPDTYKRIIDIAKQINYKLPFPRFLQKIYPLNINININKEQKFLKKINKLRLVNKTISNNEIAILVEKPIIPKFNNIPFEKTIQEFSKSKILYAEDQVYFLNTVSQAISYAILGLILGLLAQALEVPISHVISLYEELEYLLEQEENGCLSEDEKKRLRYLKNLFKKFLGLFLFILIALVLFLNKNLLRTIFFFLINKKQTETEMNSDPEMDAMYRKLKNLKHIKKHSGVIRNQMLKIIKKIHLKVEKESTHNRI